MFFIEVSVAVVNIVLIGVVIGVDVGKFIDIIVFVNILSGVC